MGDDIDYALVRLDDLESAIIETDRSIEDIPQMLYSMSESYSFLANRITSMEQALIEKKILKEGAMKRMLN